MMMINGEEWKVAELPEEMRKWIRDKYESEEMKTYHVMEMMMKRCRMEIPREMERKENDIKHGYIGK